MPATAKICGLSTPETVRAALDGGASHLGFNFFAKSPRHVTPEAAARLAEPARGRAVIVAVTVDPDDVLLDLLLTTLRPDLIQLHGAETPARAAAVAQRTGAGIVKALPVSDASDVAAAISDGHDLGCHTFDHVDGSVVTAAAFERSIKANQAALADSGLDADFKVFAYPLNGPAVGTKRVVERYFAGSRGGGQTFNRDVVDLNLLKSYFVDARSRDNFPNPVQRAGSYAPVNGPALDDLFDFFDFPSPHGF